MVSVLGLPKELMYIQDYEAYLDSGMPMTLEGQRWVETHKDQLNTKRKRDNMFEHYRPHFKEPKKRAKRKKTHFDYEKDFAKRYNILIEADTTTTQHVYIHLLEDLANEDNNRIMSVMTGL